jgi:hypothetical protein
MRKAMFIRFGCGFHSRHMLLAECPKTGTAALSTFLSYDTSRNATTLSLYCSDSMLLCQPLPFALVIGPQFSLGFI